MTLVLTIAGSDSIGGAGLQADLKAIAAMGIHGASVVTAVTSQNTSHVNDIKALTAKQVISQLDAVLDDAHVDAVKTGMLYSSTIARAVMRRLEDYPGPLVIDPVMVAGVGDKLHALNLLDSLRKDVLPRATIVTPNREEAEKLSGLRITKLADAEEACRRIAQFGSKAVLLKGGHLQGDKVTDLFWYQDRVMELTAPRLDVKVHGAGCTLASFLACGLAKGGDLRTVVLESKRRIHDSIAMAYPVGRGQWVIDPMATTTKLGLRYQYLERVTKAVQTLEERLPVSWIPEVGMNLVFALPNAQGYDEVCGVSGRIVNLDGHARRVGDVRFGASKHVARIVLVAQAVDNQVNSVLNLRFREEHLVALQRLGLSMAGFDRDEEPADVSTMEWGTRHSISEHGSVPDIIFDRGGQGKEPMIRVLGQSPEDILRKIGPLLRS